MKKSLYLTLLLGIINLNAESLIIDKEKLSFNNNIKIGSLSNVIDAQNNATSYNTIAIGGEIGVSYKLNNKVSLTTSLYYNKNLNNMIDIAPKNELAGLKEQSGNDDYIYFGEAYVAYQPNVFTNIMLGYQSFDLSFFNTNDIRINKNSFEALALEYIGFDNIYLYAGYINRMAGKDLRNNELVNSKYDYMYGNPLDKIGQVSFGGAKYMYSPFTKITVEGYNIADIANVFYGEIETGHNYNDILDTKLKAQLSQILEVSNSLYEGNVFGVHSSIEYKKYILEASYNKASITDNKYINITKGIAPYYTTTENMSVEELNSEADAFQIALSKKFFDINLKGSYSYYKTTNGLQEYSSMDIKGIYNYDDNFKFGVTFTNLNNELVDTDNKYIVFTTASLQF
jgi:hypothetical protein